MLIRIAVFLSGAVLMAVEVLAFLINATTFGSAWREMTAVIAVFLAAMSAGYWVGGRLGDRYPRPRTLVCTLAGAGLLVLLVPVLADPIKRAVFDSRLPLSIHSLLASVLIYFLPTLLLAAISPIAIRLLARSVERTGSVAGGIAALSAIGSIAGTIVTGFYLIEALAVFSILYLLGAAMLLMAGLVGLGQRSRTEPIVALTVLLLGTTSVGAQQRILYERQSLYNRILVTEEPGVERSLQFNITRQTTMHPSRPLEGFLEYVDYAYCALLFNPEIRRVLVLGLGGGSVPKRFLHDFPHVRVDAVEIDPVVVEVAREYFALPDDPRLRVYVQDGRVFLKRSKDQYDLIIMDAYSATRYGLAVPRHMTTKEFLEEVRDHLTPNGVLMFNVATYLSRYDNRMARAVSRTIATVFASQYAWDVETTLNTIMLAPKLPHELTKGELMARAEQLVASGTIKLPAFTNRVARLRTSLYRVDDVPVLTDQYAPVDRLMLEPEPN